MLLSTIFPLENFLQGDLLQMLELVIIFVSLYGMIVYLLMTAENKKYFQKQK